VTGDVDDQDLPLTVTRRHLKINIDNAAIVFEALKSMLPLYSVSLSLADKNHGPQVPRCYVIVKFMIARD
jgi:hypothetical protein